MNRTRHPEAGLWPRIWRVLRGAAAGYAEDRVPQLGAALAFYLTVAIVPLTILILGFARLIFDNPAARNQIISQIERLAGLGRQSLRFELPAEHLHSIAAWLGFIIFLLGGFGVFSHLQSALNIIWRAPKFPDETFWQMLRRMTLSVGTVLVTGFIVLVSLTLSALLDWLAQSASKWAGWPSLVAELGNFIFSFAVITVLFAVIFKLLPDVTVRWKDVWTGSAITALLFNLGKTALAFYFAHSQISSAYGAAGSLVALLMWSYYAGQILFFGAEITRVHTELRAGKL